TTMVPLALYRTATTTRPLARTAGLLCMLTLLVTTALTFSRGPLITFAIGGLIGFWVVRSSRLRFAFLAGPVLLWTMQVTIGWSLGLPFLQRFVSSDVLTMNSRTILWRTLFGYVRPSQPLGQGMGGSDVLLRQLRVTDTSGNVIATS